MGLDYSLQLIMSGVLNVTQLVGVTTSLWTMDRFGRRPLLLWGSLFMTLSHFIIAILVGKFSSDCKTSPTQFFFVQADREHRESTETLSRCSRAPPERITLN